MKGTQSKEEEIDWKIAKPFKKGMVCIIQCTFNFNTCWNQTIFKAFYIIFLLHLIGKIIWFGRHKLQVTELKDYSGTYSGYASNTYPS